jgi:hypothetical protein
MKPSVVSYPTNCGVTIHLNETRCFADEEGKLNFVCSQCGKVSHAAATITTVIANANLRADTNKWVAVSLRPSGHTRRQTSPFQRM